MLLKFSFQCSDELVVHPASDSSNPKPGSWRRKAGLDSTVPHSCWTLTLYRGLCFLYGLDLPTLAQWHRRGLDLGLLSRVLLSYALGGISK